MATKATPKMSLKLLINKNDEAVVFAEAEKDFIDFLFNLLTLPIGTITSYLPKESCLGDLHESIKKLEEAYLHPNQSEDSPLKMNTSAYAISPFFNPSITSFPNDRSFEYSPWGHEYSSFGSDSLRRHGPSRKHGPSRSHSHVQGLVTYMVTNDLSVTPMSMIATMALFKKYNIGEADILEEKVVTFGLDEALQLLKFGLQSKAALTNVFL